MKVQCFLYNTEATEPDIVIPAGRKELTGFDTREEKDQKKKKHKGGEQQIATNISTSTEVRYKRIGITWKKLEDSAHMFQYGVMSKLLSCKFHHCSYIPEPKIIEATR